MAEPTYHLRSAKRSNLTAAAVVAAVKNKMAEGGADDDETLGAWALRYRGVATFGALALLLGTGKFVGFHWHRLAFLRRAVVPPSVISGLLGCVVYRMFKGLLSPGVKSSLDESLSEVGGCCWLTVDGLF